MIILAVLLTTTAAVTYVHTYFFRGEKLQLIDSQIKKSASILINSELADLKKIDLEEADDIISEELGSDRIGKLFLIRNAAGDILYSSRNFEALGRELPRTPQWVTVQSPEYFIRVVNLEIPKKDRILQVGVLLDTNFLSWTIINRRVLLYIALIAGFIFVVSAALTSVLLTPIRKLSAQLKARALDLKNHSLPLQGLSDAILDSARTKWARSDEFSVLVLETEGLIHRINRYHTLTRAWTFQLAHELKTPLALARTEVETLADNGQIAEPGAAFILREIDSISETVRQFLDWAELENSFSGGRPHVIRLMTFLEQIRSRFDRLYPQRLSLVGKSNSSVLANPLHLEQLLGNLIGNALKFSPADRPVEIKVDRARLSIVDHGDGIPEGVMQKLGQPFNYGKNRTAASGRGSGLGLAWAHTVARLYGWELNVTTGVRGTAIEVGLVSIEESEPRGIRTPGAATELKPAT